MLCNTATVHCSCSTISAALYSGHKGSGGFVKGGDIQSHTGEGGRRVLISLGFIQQRRSLHSKQIREMSVARHGTARRGAALRFFNMRAMHKSVKK